MENTLLVGLSRQMALTHELDVIANNIANIDTTGYKSDNAMFEEYLMPRASDQSFIGQDRRIRYVEDRASWIDMSQGAIQQHRQSARRRHQRQRLFCRANAERTATLYAQRRVFDQRHRPARHQRRQSGDRQIPGRSPSSRPITTSPSAGPASSRCARATARPIRRAALFNSSTSRSRSFCRRTAARPSRRPPASPPDPAPANTYVVQGAIEKSNVNGVAAMARLIEITRSYTDIANILQAQSDERRSALTQLSQTPSS